VWLGTRQVTDVLLAVHDQFRIGSTVFEYRSNEAEDDNVEPSFPTMTMTEPSALDQVEGASRFVLRLRRIGEPEESYRDAAIEGSEAIVGRSKDCAVVVDDISVSRRHVKVEVAPDGLRVSRLGGRAGLWIDGAEVDQVVLRSGQQFGLGTVYTVEVLHPASAESAPPATEQDAALLVPVDRPSEDDAETGRGGPLPSLRVDDGATQMLSSNPLAPTTPSEPETDLEGPAQPEVEDGATRMLSSASLAALHEDRATESDPGGRADDGATRGIPTPFGPSAGPRAPGGVESDPEGDLGGTIMLPSTPELLKETQRFQAMGESVEADPHQPFLLDDPESIWYVVSGGLEIFTVAVDKGRPTGTRDHFLGISSGQCCFGFDLLSYGMGSGFLAVAKRGTTLRRIPRQDLRGLTQSPAQAPAVAALIETWVSGLCKVLIRDSAVKRVDEKPLEPGEPLSLAAGERATSLKGVVWTDVFSGSVSFDDLSIPVFDERLILLPVSPDAWIRSVSEEFGNVVVHPVRTTDVVADPMLWNGIDVFHRLLCECEFINKRLANVDEYLRLEEKGKVSAEARQDALGAIAGVLASDRSQPREFLDRGETEPVLNACRVIGGVIGMAVKSNLTDDEDLTYEERIAAIAGASGFRTRVVALRDEWWKEDHGAFLAQFAETKSPVAIIPTGPRSYEAIDPKTAQSVKVNAELAERLSQFGYAFYRPFPDGELTVGDVMRFGAQGLIKDFRLLIAMGVIVGALGTLTPWVTGKIFDEAIPQADRNLLLTFSMGLFATALATSAYKITQGVATVRVQGKMEYGIQSALWDRLLNLPANFFRNYSSGDLADRVSGVDAIQGLVSGAGVAAILGSLSGLAYVAQMLTFDLYLAGSAIGLTLFFVLFTTGANYLQLTYQRREISMRGRITGLVLNLITGVTKLRLCGAEHHAFRVWAKQFSAQRKISFTVGTIQNVVAVFTSIFPVLSSMAIFYVMLTVQQRAMEEGTPGITIGEFIAFNAAYGLFLAAMQALGEASLNLLRVVPIFERLKPIITVPAEVDSSKAFPGKLTGKISLSHLSFRYTDDGPWIINDLSLDIKPGEFVAFVGGSGCGKSTLMRLMLGFEQPTKGVVYYDGQDLNSLDTRQVRQQMGVVLQVSRVMPTEIYRNITGVSSKSIADAWSAAEMAGLAEDIRAMPMGMHTYVSEGGGTLSGGQRQRLLIARAIVNRPRILFLDEATSALDNKTQATVTESMDRMDSTRIAIAHRLSTIAGADKICYLEKGQIVEMGTYDELMEKDGLFAESAKRQMA
jgi:ATP-binding cassette subfamily C protein